MANDTHCEILIPIEFYQELLEKYGPDDILVVWAGNEAQRQELKEKYRDIRIIKSK